MHLRTLLTASLAVIVGCYPSENPIWTPETLVYLPELLGVYQDDQPTTEKNTTTLEKGEAEKSYRVIMRNGEGEKTGEATLRLVKLGDSLFYDYEPSGAKLDNVDPPLEGLHFFGRLEVNDNRIQLYSFGSHIPMEEAFRWKTITRDGEESRVIANSTEELQAFLIANEKKMTVPEGSFTKLSD
jgi:hypothetical protein